MKWNVTQTKCGHCQIELVLQIFIIYDNQFVTNAKLDMFIVWGKEMPKHFCLISSIWKIIFMYVQTLTNHSFQMHLIRNMIIINNGNLKYFCNIYVYIFPIFYEAKKIWKWNWTTSIKRDWQSKVKKNQITSQKYIH